MLVGSIWAGAAIALAGIVVGAILGFASAEVSDYLRRRRETSAAALLVFQELVSVYSDVRRVMGGLVERPEEMYLRRTAWENHGLAIARALPDEDVHRLARAYSALDDLDRLLRAGAPAEEFKKPEHQEWLQTNVSGDVETAMKVLGRLTSLDEETVAERIAKTQAAPTEDE